MQGWLCRHILCILTHVVNVTSIPSQYIMKRWTKAAKQGTPCDEIGQSSQDAVQSKTLCLKRLMRLAFNVMNFSANHDVTEELATTTLLRLRSQITKKMKCLTDNDHVDFLVESDESEDAENSGIRVCDPLRRRPKGVPNTRLKSIGEKRKRKASSCARVTLHKD
ncbi:protein FAR-RED IMPAIRED RESPONSE 1-like isoform X2 [Syzygium oleosum]|uniref:protein FAR-RED IMPAIRED RESPONSE 1-like isoform X1 n=1 Tax=Syzygium oleosum TaxID=219896 RepID=UPI0024BA47EE|nr:protein FAR-RED IMPAIRED RESPONSE 1-like isoform X1 [Syzygium oleosum]XP_056165348.1 protein FAR-RED IMPAIRED RESPONSE 1-like isoform X2 [Syzygium oleosum]